MASSQPTARGAKLVVRVLILLETPVAFRAQVVIGCRHERLVAGLSFGARGHAARATAHAAGAGGRRRRRGLRPAHAASATSEQRRAGSLVELRLSARQIWTSSVSQLLLVVPRRHRRFLILQNIDLALDGLLLDQQIALRRIEGRACARRPIG